MISLFYGVGRTMQNTAQLLSVCAFEAAVGLSRKTLVLQFCNERPVENLLIGKQYLIDSASGLYIGDDSGMASLLRKTRVTGLMDEHFGSYCIQPIPSFQGNAFDVAGVPRIVDFKEEMIEHQDAIVELLKKAEKLYDEIFVLADGGDEELLSILESCAKKKVVCVLQGYGYPIPHTDKDTIFACMDFDESSKVGSASAMKSKYGAKRFFAIPYNVDFNDACADNNVLRMLVHNNAAKREENSPFVSAVRRLVATLLGMNEKDFESGVSTFDMQNFLEVEKGESFVEESALLSDEVSVEEKRVGFLKKKTVVEVHAKGAAVADGKKKRKKQKFSESTEGGL